MCQWRRIFHWLLEYNDELFGEVLGQLTADPLSALTHLLKSKATEQAQKCEVLKRLIFLLLSGDKDRFVTIYPKLLTRVVEGIAASDSSVVLLGQYIALLKVMFLRFGCLNDPKSMASVWPHVQHRLVQVFMLGEHRLDDKLWLLVDGLRLLEVLSALNVEDHVLFQWVFITDCISHFGVTP